jgi:hypothetical protein
MRKGIGLAACAEWIGYFPWPERPTNLGAPGQPRRHRTGGVNQGRWLSGRAENHAPRQAKAPKIRSISSTKNEQQQEKHAMKGCTARSLCRALPYFLETISDEGPETGAVTTASVGNFTSQLELPLPLALGKTTLKSGYN